MHKESLNNNSLIRLVEFETMFIPFDVCSGFRGVATDKVAEFITIFHIKIPVSADYCIFIIMITPKLTIQLLLVTSSFNYLITQYQII